MKWPIALVCACLVVLSTWAEVTAREERAEPGRDRAEDAFGAEFSDGAVALRAARDMPDWSVDLSLVECGLPRALPRPYPISTGDGTRFDRGRCAETWLRAHDGFRVRIETGDGFKGTSPTLAVFKAKTRMIGLVSPDGTTLRFYNHGHPVIQFSGVMLGRRVRFEWEWETGQINVRKPSATPRSEGARQDAPAASGPLDLFVRKATTGAVGMPDHLFVGGQAVAQFGESVATAGDLDKDGLSELLVGAPAFNLLVGDDSIDDSGVVRLFVRSGSDPLEPQVVLTSPRRDDLVEPAFGSLVASAGDVDGDGHQDVIVREKGTLYLYRGAANGIDTEPAWGYSSKTLRAGTRQARIGDLNGDGFGDLVVGRITDFAVFCGSDADPPLPDQPDWKSPTPAFFPNPNEQLRVAPAGDFNGDGFSDFLVAVDGFFSDDVFLYLGGASGCDPPEGPATPHWQIVAGDLDGVDVAVAPAGDVNGDGFADVVIGWGGIRSAAVVFGARADLPDDRCSTTSIPGVCQRLGDGSIARFGLSVAPVGDWNGDGFADVAVAGLGPEPIHVFLGSEDGLRKDARRIAAPATGNIGFGEALDSAGDFNGDGFGDLVVGAPRFDSNQQGGAAFVYFGAADSPSDVEDPAWDEVLAGGAQFEDVAFAGDVNGDGFSDVAIARSTGVEVHQGFPAGAGPETTLLGYSGTHSVASAGDVNGDGFGDVVLGTLLGDNESESRVRFFTGTPLGPEWARTFPRFDCSRFGVSVAPAGDINGDGFGDVIVGASGNRGLATRPPCPMNDGQPTPLPTAVLFLGCDPSSSDAECTGPVKQDRRWRPVGKPESESSFGASVASAGDVNGDGFADVIVGAPCEVAGEDCVSEEGRAYVYLGSTRGLSNASVWQSGGLLTYGTQVANAGDVNGDGYSDVIVGQSNTGGVDARAFLFHGSPAGPSRVADAIIETAANSRISVGSAGDVNGDGFADLIVGLRDVDQTRIYLGSSDGLRSDCDINADGVLDPCPVDDWNPVGPSSFGADVGTAGDVNGDGFADVVVGVPLGDPDDPDSVRAFVYLGNDGGGLPRIPRQLRLDGTTLPHLGVSDDVDAIRIQALVRSVSADGEFGLEWETQQLGVPFNGEGPTSTRAERGTPLQHPQPGLTPGSPAVLLDSLADQLSAGSGPDVPEAARCESPPCYFHWRARIVSDAPFAPHSSWFASPPGATSESKFRTAGDLPIPTFARIGPQDNELIFPDTEPLTFSWNRGISTVFCLQFARNSAFSGPTLTFSVTRTEGQPIDTGSPGVQTFTPNPAHWQDILDLARNPDFREIPVFWRVENVGCQFLDTATEREQRAILVNPAQPVSVESPMDCAPLPSLGEEPPTFVWSKSHNRCFRVRFSSSATLSDPVDSDSTSFDDDPGVCDDNAAFPISARPHEDLVFWTPSAGWWETQVRTLGAPIYWSVHAVDSLDRLTRSEVRAFACSEKRRSNSGVQP